MAGEILLSVRTWPQRYVSLRNNPSGTVSGWDGDPGPAGHLVFQEREGHFLISTEQWPKHFFRLVKDDFSSYLHVVGKRGEPGKPGQFVLEEMPGYLLISSKQWPDWFLFLDELGRLRAEPGDPGSKGHFLLNKKILQESDGLPPIIQTMYLIQNKDREHAAAMSLLSNQKEEVRAREVAVLQAQMTSERAASEAHLHDTNREHDETCEELHRQMEEERQKAAAVLAERDRTQAEELARREAEFAEALAALNRQMDEERAAAALALRTAEQRRAREVEALTQLHKDELRATVEEKDGQLRAAVAQLRHELTAQREAEVAELQNQLEQVRKSAAKVLLEKETLYNVEMQALVSAREKIYQDLLQKKDETHQAEVAFKDAQHAEALEQLSSEKDTTWALAMSKCIEEKDQERMEIVNALTNHFQAEDKNSFKFGFWRADADKKKVSPESVMVPCPACGDKEYQEPQEYRCHGIGRGELFVATEFMAAVRHRPETTWASAGQTDVIQRLTDEKAVIEDQLRQERLQREELCRQLQALEEKHRAADLALEEKKSLEARLERELDLRQQVAEQQQLQKAMESEARTVQRLKELEQEEQRQRDEARKEQELRLRLQEEHKLQQDRESELLSQLDALKGRTWAKEPRRRSFRSWGCTLPGWTLTMCPRHQSSSTCTRILRLRAAWCTTCPLGRLGLAPTPTCAAWRSRGPTWLRRSVPWTTPRTWRCPSDPWATDW
ncbi:unnamed protein product [Effrenium voratum]|nr:unnamed protein product [Effrenium voratum]